MERKKTSLLSNALKWNTNKDTNNSKKKKKTISFFRPFHFLIFAIVILLFLRQTFSSHHIVGEFVFVLFCLCKFACLSVCEQCMCARATHTHIFRSMSVKWHSSFFFIFLPFFSCCWLLLLLQSPRLFIMQGYLGGLKRDEHEKGK